MFQSRKARGKTQKLFLVECRDIENNTQKVYDIMGTTGNVYTVIIKKEPTCTCPDFMTRHQRCKHIYFALIKIMKVKEEDEDTKEFSVDELKTMFSNIPKITNNLEITSDLKNKYTDLKNKEKTTSIEVKRKSLDDLCPICLDDLSNGDDIDYCKYTCGKNIHKACFEMWSKQQNNKCVFCKQSWNITNNYEYIKLL